MITERHTNVTHVIPGSGDTGALLRLAVEEDALLQLAVHESLSQGGGAIDVWQAINHGEQALSQGGGAIDVWRCGLWHQSEQRWVVASIRATMGCGINQSNGRLRHQPE